MSKIHAAITRAVEDLDAAERRYIRDLKDILRPGDILKVKAGADPDDEGMEYVTVKDVDGAIHLVEDGWNTQIFVQRARNTGFVHVAADVLDVERDIPDPKEEGWDLFL